MSKQQAYIVEMLAFAIALFNQLYSLYTDQDVFSWPVTVTAGCLMVIVFCSYQNPEAPWVRQRNATRQQQELSFYLWLAVPVVKEQKSPITDAVERLDRIESALKLVAKANRL